MGEMSRAKDAVLHNPCEATLDAYAEVVRTYFLTDIEGDLSAVRLAVEESHSSAAVMVLAWVNDILYRDRT